MMAENDVFIAAALEWVSAHTTIKVESYDASILPMLPARVQLFCQKFAEIMQRRAGVASQSIEGLSMAFDTGMDADAAIWHMARTLLGGYIKSQARVLPAQRRW